MSDSLNRKFMLGGGESGALMRSFDWSKTSLGLPEQWPVSLKIGIRILLDCKLPMYIAWGPEFIGFYNDAYRPILGNKHPAAMGAKTYETWDEIWPTIGPMWMEVLKGNSIGFDDFKLTIERFGYPEDCYFNFSYSSVPDDNGDIAGVMVTFAETTEKVLGQIKLQAQHAHLFSVFQQAPMPVSIVTGPDFIFTLCNQANQVYYGDLNIIGMKATDVPGVTPELIKILKNVYESGERFVATSYPVEINNNGSVQAYFFDFIYEPLRDDQGNIHSIIATSMDVTATVIAKIQAEQSEKIYRGFLDTIPQIVWSTDITGKVIYFNSKWWDYTGLDPKTYDRTTASTVVHPDDWPHVKAETQHSFETGTVFERQYRIRSASGTYSWFLGRLVPLRDDSGTIYQWIGTTTNVDALVEAQSRFTAFFEQSSLPMEIYALDGHPVQVNTAWEKLFDTTMEELEGYNILQDPQIKSLGILPLIEMALNGEAVEVPPFYYDPAKIKKVGRPRWLESSFFPVKDSNGRVIEFAMILRDVSDREKAQSDLIDTNKKLEEAVSARQELLNICGHELKTPLSSLKLQTQTTQRKISKGDHSVYEPQKVNKLLDSYGNQIERLVHLVDDMLDLTRISSGKLKLNRDKIDLGYLVHEVTDRYSDQLQAAGCDLTVQVKEHVEGSWDRFRIEQVLSNLVTNAIKYGKGHPVQVTVTKSADEEKAVLVVKDEGMGIASENHDRIFNRFERAVSANEVSGLGLGLFIAKEIALNHGGNINVESEIGKGAAFIVELPL